MSNSSKEKRSNRTSADSVDENFASLDFAEEDCHGLLSGQPKRLKPISDHGAKDAPFRFVYMIPWFLSAFLAACLFALIIHSSKTERGLCRQAEFWRQKEFSKCTK